MVGTLRLWGRLGAGGMGRVFLGSTPAGRAVAVKVVHPELAADPAFRKRFRGEVAAARMVSGAYTAPVVAAGPDDDPPWMATALVAGPSLAETVAGAGPLPPDAVWRLAAGLAEALAAIHACRLVHRDLKPSNVLLDIDGPRVIDFGVSRALDGTALTATGLMVGTPMFMSPEQAENAPTSPASDVFSLGSVLTFAAAGTGPFGGGRPAHVLYRVVHAEPALGAVPAGLRPLVAACLAKDPAARPTLPALTEAIAAGSPSWSEAGPPGPFWPDTVNLLIRRRQELFRAAPYAGGDSGRDSPGEAGGDAGQRPWSRRILIGLAVAGAAGLAVAGWELSPGTDSSGKAAKGSPRGTPRPRVTGPPAWLARLRPGTEIWTMTPVRGVASSPFASGDVVYVGGFGGGKLYALRARTGSTLWSTGFRLGAEAVVTTPGTVYVIDGEFTLHALRAADGTALWSGHIGGGVAQGPVVAGRRVYVVGYDNSVYALGAVTGTVLWRALLTGMPAGAPAVARGAVYIADDGGVVRALSTSSGTQLWTASIKGAATPATATMVPITPPMVAGGVVYIASVDRILHALRAADGRTLWTTGIPGGAGSFPAVADGIVYITGNDGYLYALKAGGAGAVSWRTRINGRVQSYPVVADGTIYIASSDHRVHVLRAADGSPSWSTGIGGGAAFPPAAAGGILYITANDRRLYALRG
jgi:outer membrane protein assembly factor BamB